MKLVSKTAAQTKALAAKIAHKILRTKNSKLKTATVVALVGDLGAGKTTFVQGFAKALGVKHKVNSPTFLIMRPYPIKATRNKRQETRDKRQATSDKKQETRNKRQETRDKKQETSFKLFVHVDVYRINKISELENLHFKHVLEQPENIVVIEWADKIKRIVPKDAIWLHFSHGRTEKERLIAD